MGTTDKGYPYAEGSDAPDAPAQGQALAEKIDASPGILIATYAQINALAGVELWEGRRVYQSDTGANRPVEGEYTYNGVNWRLPWNLPWGLLPNGEASITAVPGASPYGAVTDIAGLSVTVATVANRRLKISAWGRFVKNGSGYATLYLTANGLDRTLWHRAVPDGETETVQGFYLDTPAAGSTVYKLRAEGNESTGTVGAVASATNPFRGPIVEDCGPNGSPA